MFVFGIRPTGVDPQVGQLWLTSLEFNTPCFNHHHQSSSRASRAKTQGHSSVFEAYVQAVQY